MTFPNHESNILVDCLPETIFLPFQDSVRLRTFYSFLTPLIEIHWVVVVGVVVE